MNGVYNMRIEETKPKLYITVYEDDLLEDISTIATEICCTIRDKAEHITYDAIVVAFCEHANSDATFLDYEIVTVAMDGGRYRMQDICNNYYDFDPVRLAVMLLFYRDVIHNKRFYPSNTWGK